MEDRREASSRATQSMLNCELFAACAVRWKERWAQAVPESESIPESPLVQGKPMFLYRKGREPA